MPKAKSKQRTNSDSDEEYGATQTQASQATLTQAQKALSGVNSDELERKVNDLVQFLLIQDQKKVPIKRQDINKHVLKEHSKAFPVFMEKAGQKLENIFAIKLVELEGKSKSYILINEMDIEPEAQHQAWSDEDNGKMGLIMVALSVIFMKGNVIVDTELYHFLRKLGVDIDTDHELFGDVKKFLTVECVRHGYLEVTRVPNTDPPSYEFRWGQRAKHETSKRHVLDFVCQIYDIQNPEIWTSQFQDVLRSEGQGTSLINNGTTENGEVVDVS